jgi:hypothetical protein
MRTSLAYGDQKMIAVMPAFLGLWNGCRSSSGEYDRWHTTEHVPQRLTVPGITAARRYVAGSGPLPEYFTIYILSDLSVLKSVPYQALLERPTVWSSQMRHNLIDVLRHGCQTVINEGQGIGGTVAVRILEVDRRRLCELPSLIRHTGFSAVRSVTVGIIDHSGPQLPFEVNSMKHPVVGNVVLLAEGYSEPSLREELQLADQRMSAAKITLSSRWTFYQLAFAMEPAPDREGAAKKENVVAGITEN